MIRASQQIVKYILILLSLYFLLDHFSKCNAYLLKHGYEPIDWNVDGDDIMSSNP